MNGLEKSDNYKTGAVVSTVLSASNADVSLGVQLNDSRFRSLVRDAALSSYDQMNFR
jgi:hypothetical protein